MRRLLLLLNGIVVSGVVFARTILVPTQPVSPYLDTEVSTNIVINAGLSDVRQIDVHFQLAGTPTNDLEVAFGCDVNTNGVLDAEETDAVYGWRGGRYFIENTRTWERFETEAATNALCGVWDVQLKNDSSLRPKLFEATCGGETAFAELSTRPPPAWLYRKEWNRMRVTRRGVGTPSEWIRCDIEYPFFFIRLR